MRASIASKSALRASSVRSVGLVSALKSSTEMRIAFGASCLVMTTAPPRSTISSTRPNRFLASVAVNAAGGSPRRSRSSARGSGRRAAGAGRAAGFLITPLLVIFGQKGKRARAARHLQSFGEFVTLAPIMATARSRARIDPDTRVVAIGNMFSFLWPLTREIIHAIRAARPDVVIVGGGEHFTALTEHSMQQAPLDFIAMVEGEETALALMDALAAGGKDYGAIAGVAWRDGHAIRVNPRRDRSTNVDALPWPAWHLFNVRGYDEREVVNAIHQGLTVAILATRGCPYQCTYCSSPNMWTQRWIPRDPVDVAEEVEHLHRTYGAVNFPFQDLTAIIRKDWIVAFCREILRRA